MLPQRLQVINIFLGNRSLTCCDYISTYVLYYMTYLYTNVHTSRMKVGYADGLGPQGRWYGLICLAAETRPNRFTNLNTQREISARRCTNQLECFVWQAAIYPL